MELSSGQRKAAFVLIVLILAGLGAFLFGPKFGAGAANGASQSPKGSTPAPPPSTPAPAPSTLSPTPTVSSTPPDGTTGGTKGGHQPDIYQWLPFTQAELTAASRDVTRFGTAYGTWSYTENTASYVGSMRKFIDPSLSQLLSRGYAAPGVAGPRVRQKQVAVGSASITSLRAYGRSSLTFIVMLSQHITSSKGHSSTSVPYAVTVAGTGGSWQVSDIEPASDGNS
jgi:hypothetical protein